MFKNIEFVKITNLCFKTFLMTSIFFSKVFKKTFFFTFEGLSRLVLALITFPVFENNRSEGADVAIMLKYLRATADKDELFLDFQNLIGLAFK